MSDFDVSILLSGPYHELLLKGLILSLVLLGVTLLLSLPLALLIALLRLSPLAPLRTIAWLFVESIRNVPLLAHMLFWYFGAPELLPESLREWLYGHSFEAIAAVVALTLYTSAYMSEDMRSGIRAVPRVQFEASRALGLGFLASLRLVVLPQALRVTVPPLVSQTLNLWKNTSIATVIGAAELMYQAAKVETATFRSFEPFVFATVAYLTLSLLITGLGAWYQRCHPVRAI
ncbi:MAG: amino acid ABC transporter permease [Hydrogenophaga sp.]|jgi:polar amino acid transport system permease protein|uniref:amino acid ABC transporter permease n=1 Tax=Hydrogenophaga sp. TaxID=1904254 RepID=UPI00261C808A|nr:amino acid ABC transporter permease [Hydrogenophaga sp.]MDD3786267.1 amino acid ABC transporter permease [Hydrogenophaga sp.]